MTKPMRTVSFKLPGELDRAVDDMARQRGISRAAVVREAIAAYRGTRSTSVTDIVDALDLTFDGPSDLSTNPGYFDGFGT